MNNKMLALFYDKLFSDNLSDFDFYKFFFEQKIGPILEIGSGTGRLFLEYLKLGLDIEGIEPNKFMTEVCLEKSKNFNRKPIIYVQQLQKLQIGKKYKTIYMPLYVFQNIINRNEAIEALTLSYKHLENNGQILISIYMPWNDPTGTWENSWRILKTYTGKDENLILSEAVKFNVFEQIETKYLKFETFKSDSLINQYLITMNYRFYSRYELTIMLENASFKNIEIFGDYILQEANLNSQVFIFKANKII